MSHQSGHTVSNAVTDSLPESLSQLARQGESADDLHKEPDIITPPDNFSVVEPGLYRSSLPSAGNLPYVRALRLKRVIVLSPERPVRGIANFFDNHNIQLSHTGLHGWTAQQSWKPVSEEVVKESLEILLDRKNYPTLVCDVGGVHMVGMVIGCLRKLQNWNLNSVVNEYRSFAGAKTRYVNEQFIELFDTDLVTIPQDPPQWFVEQLEMEREERAQYDGLVKVQHVDETGTMTAVEKAEKVPQYVRYYYSSAGPLNSQIGGSEPRIQTL